jgi:hypothetical protein
VEGCWTCSWWTLSGTLVFHTWKVVGHVVGGRCQAHWFFIRGRLLDV